MNWARPGFFSITRSMEQRLAPLNRLHTGGVVFLDKDGTLVKDVPYNVDPRRIAFTPGAMEGLRILKEAGYPVVIVTNQPGLELQRFSQSEFDDMVVALIERVERESGVRIAGLCYCPHASGMDGTPKCPCRKPAPGMLFEAAASGAYDLSRSWMIGDILHDVEAGNRAGCRTVLLDVGNETEWDLSGLRNPNYRCTDLRQACELVVRVSCQEAKTQISERAQEPGTDEAELLTEHARGINSAKEALNLIRGAS